VEPHLAHAAGFGEVLAATAQTAEEGGVAVDLGSGAGLPGLTLALSSPGGRWILIEASSRRAAFLREAVVGLGIADRVEVLEERAEVAGRRPALRARVDVVVARSFGPPPVVAECAAPLLRPGGLIVVSEPPGGDPLRWPEAGLRRLGLVPGPVMAAAGATFQILVQDTVCSDRFPRRTGVPGKRPLF